MITRLHAGCLFVLAIALSLLPMNSPTLLAETNRVLRVDTFHEGELFCRGIKVDKPISLDIHAIGSAGREHDVMGAYAWIIRSGGLRPVWEMTVDNTEPFGGDEYLREYQSTQELEPGEYEIYFYAGSPSQLGSFHLSLDGIEKLLEKLEKKLSSDDQERAKIKINGKEYWIDIGDGPSDEIVEEYLLEITSDSEGILRAECGNRSDRTIAEIIQPHDDIYASVGFSLEQPMQVEIVALGEYVEYADNYADYAWIIDAGNRKRVWSMDEASAEPAGGAEKNVMTVERIELPKGDYLLYYVTDDSHSFDDWNAAPPHNPNAYGVRVTATRKEDLRFVKSYQDTYSGAALLAIVKVGDDFVETKPFRVLRDCDVRVYAIGELDERRGTFVDFGWIEDLDREESCWQMTAEKTRHAGGASKNRCFDDVIHLKKGDYLLGCVTDDSHSYGDWNSSPPYDQKNYGVSLYATSRDVDRSVVQELSDVPLSGDILVRLTCIGDDADESQTFTLDRPTRVHVVALGEGVGREMADYGWIEDVATDDVVWEMTYRRTHPAGGADKNRVVDTIILLDAGKYRAHYVTDGSHAFGSWNADPPDNPQRWGITIARTE